MHSDSLHGYFRQATISNCTIDELEPTTFDVQLLPLANLDVLVRSHLLFALLVWNGRHSRFPNALNHNEIFGNSKMNSAVKDGIHFLQSPVWGKCMSVGCPIQQSHSAKLTFDLDKDKPYADHDEHIPSLQ